VSWVILWKLILRSNREKINSQEADLFWIRDFMMLSFIPNSSSVIYELHEILKKSRYKILRMKISNRTSILAPISQGIQDKLPLNILDSEIIRAPMGIESDYIETNCGVLDYLQRIKSLEMNEYKGLKVGYVGKFSPSGYSKGIEDLLNLARLNLESARSYQISITGGSANEVVSVVNKLSDYGLTRKEVEVTGHISHPEAIRKMKHLDVLVLPMPVSKKYTGFPLKAIESIASGRIVIAARCKIYQDIFDEDFEPYWYQTGNAESLDLAIITALNDESLAERLAMGLEFSSRFTWDARTKKLLDGLMSSQCKNNS
jgi:glycosyltransferase involved in cell wall biosynthesis